MTLAHLAPKEGDANSGAASGQRARNKFADRTQANYDTETTAGIAYRGIEFYEFEEKITDIAPTPDWTDDRRVIVCDRVRECCAVPQSLGRLLCSRAAIKCSSEL